MKNIIKFYFSIRPENLTFVHYSETPPTPPYTFPMILQTRFIITTERFNIIAGYNIIISHTQSYEIKLVHPAGWVDFSVLYGDLYFTIALWVFRCQYFNKTIISKWLGRPNPLPQGRRCLNPQQY